MSPDRQREYTELHAFVDFIATYVSEIDPANSMHPTNVGKSVVEMYGKSKALEGLRQAVNDTVEMLDNASVEYIQRLDTALRERNIITFSEMRRRYAASYRRVLKRGRIKSDTEYYLVAGVLADGSSSAPQEERTHLETLLEAYRGDA